MPLFWRGINPRPPCFSWVRRDGIGNWSLDFWIWNLAAGIAVPHPRDPRLNRGRDGLAMTSAPVFARSPDSSGRRINLGGDDDRTGKHFAFQKDLFRMLKGAASRSPLLYKSPFAPIVAGLNNLYAIAGAGKSTWQPHRDSPLNRQPSRNVMLLLASEPWREGVNNHIG